MEGIDNICDEIETHLKKKKKLKTNNNNNQYFFAPPIHSFIQTPSGK